MGIIIKMSVLLTCCGYYCAFTALIGVYFFLVLAAMEYFRNPWIIVEKNMYQGNPDAKALAFLILALIELVLIFLCYWCGSASAAGDKEAAEKERAEELKAYGIADDDVGSL